MKLYPEQQIVYDEMKTILAKWNMVYLAARPRFGKSYITASIINDNTLVCTVKSAVEGWKEACEACNVNPTIINYESLHKIPQKIYDCVVIDEAPKVSKFPKMSKAREQLPNYISKDTSLIWLSGTPAIESDAQLFYQLSLSHRHSFNKYYKKGNSSAFNHWYFGSSYFKNRGNLPGYGNRTKKIVGYNKEAWDYADVKPFPEKLNPIIIKRFHDDDNMFAKIVLKTVEAPKELQETINTIKHNKCHIELNIAPMRPAQLLSKLHQLSNGHIKDDDGQVHFIDNFKAKLVYEEHPNAVVFYKFIADVQFLLEAGFKEEQLMQIDSNVMGLDLSHYDEAVIYSLTWSGQNYVQALSRLNNKKVKRVPAFYIYISTQTERDIYEAVSHKRDYNERFLRK